MLHLKSLTSGFSRTTIHQNAFLIAEQHLADVAPILERFFTAPSEYKLLDKPEVTRGVYLLPGRNDHWVLKFNRLTSWKKQLRNFFGLKKTYGLYDLTNEFINLRKITTPNTLTPSVGAFGYRTRNKFFVQDEYLLVRYFAEHCDIDAFLKSSPGETESILDLIFRLFSDMLSQGFCHLDPHPKNILISHEHQLRLIDFECCTHKVHNKAFALGFLHGYFYTYWFKQFIDKERYHIISRHHIESAHPELDMLTFDPVYLRFRDSKVSRSTRHLIMTCAKSQKAFLKSLIQPEQA